MSMIEKAILTKIAKTKKIKIATLGLRFDKVANRLIDHLHSFGEETLPSGTTVLVTVTAPILVPTKTAAELCRKIDTLSAGTATPLDEKVTINGNTVRIRVLKHSDARAPKLLGVVHNRTSDPRIIFEFFEDWLVF